MTRPWWQLLVAIVGAVLLAIVATTPPAPLGTDAPPGEFAAARAMQDIRRIGRAPHPAGSVENVRVREYLVARLRRIGFIVRTTTSPVSTKGRGTLRGWTGHDYAPAIVNVVATLPGLDRAKPAVLVMAHYDSVWASPGAADDSAGIASALELGRAIRAQGAPPRDLILLLTDGEELGLEGSHAFFDGRGDPARGHVGVIVNLETRGGGGRATMFETGHDNGAMMQLFGRAVRQPSATSLSVFVYEHLPNDTDFTPAKRLGFPGFNFAFIGRPAMYHSPLATPDRVDQGAVQDLGAQALDLTRELLAAPVLPAAAPNRVFFDAYGLATIGYPPVVGWAVLAAAILLLGIAEVRSRRPIRDWFTGAGAMLAILLAAAALLYLANLVSGADGPTNYYDRLAAVPRLEVQALLVCLAVLVLAAALFRDRSGATIAGLAIPLLALAITAQILAPTAAFVLAGPLLLAAIGAAFGGIAAMAATALGVGYLIGLGFLLMEGVGPGLPIVAALPLASSALIAWPLLPALDRKRAGIVSVVLLLAAIAIALWVRLDPVAASIPPYSYFR